MASKKSIGWLSSHQGRKTINFGGFLKEISSPITRMEDIRLLIRRQKGACGLDVFEAMSSPGGGFGALRVLFFCLGYQKGKELGSPQNS